MSIHIEILRKNAPNKYLLSDEGIKAPSNITKGQSKKQNKNTK